MNTIICIKTQIGNEYAENINSVLGTYACAIQNRINLNESSNPKYTSDKIILLFITDKNIVNVIINHLKSLSNIEVKTIQF